VTRDESPGPIARLLGADHARLDELLARASDDPAAYSTFREGLLRHIGMEEKILLPAAQRARGGEPLPAAARLRLDHGALAALLVPPPTPALLRALHGILVGHNALEEGPDGVYAACERLAGSEIGTLVAALEAAPGVSVNPNVDSELVMDATRRALARAGYALEDFRD
jgi:hypothetical protein